MSSNIEKEQGPQGDSVEQTPSPPESEQEPEKRKREYKDFGHDEEKPTRMYCLFKNYRQPLSLL
jgi:H+-transporting ATPase